MEGHITRLYKSKGHGFVLTPDGWEVPFCERDLNGVGFAELDLGAQMEFTLVGDRWIHLEMLRPATKAFRKAS